MVTEIETVDADDKRAIVFASDYLNKLSGEQIERECRRNGWKRDVYRQVERGQRGAEPDD